MNNAKTLIDSILESVQLADGPVSCQQVVDDLLKIGIRRDKQNINAALQTLISRGKICRAEKADEKSPTLYQIAVDGVAVNPDPVPAFEGKIQRLPEKIEIGGVIAATPSANIKKVIEPVQQTQPTESALNAQIGGDHYRLCKVQPVEYIEANSLPFLEGCVIKRITRHDKPSGKGRQDIEKAMHELKLILELRYGNTG